MMVWTVEEHVSRMRARSWFRTANLGGPFGFGAADCGSVRLGAPKGRPNTYIVSLIFDLLSKAWHLGTRLPLSGGAGIDDML